MENSIIDLKEIVPDNWQAKYQGNYGIYTVKIVSEREKTVRFSCTCPSGASPCKHISIVQDAINKCIERSRNSEKTPAIGTAELLSGVSQQELYDFIVRQAEHNPEFARSVLLEFIHKKTDDKNRYSRIIRKELSAEKPEFENYYEYGLSLEFMDQWLEKARSFLGQENYNEAILLCKACIEEYAAWVEKVDCEELESIDSSYQSDPFKILKSAFKRSSGVNAKELYDYCISEMKKEKYVTAGMLDGFHELLLPLARDVNQEEFIALQDSLLNGIKGSGYEEKILRRKIDFYQSCGYQERAWKLVEDNLQIESFRRDVVENLINREKYGEAKKLIDDYLAVLSADNEHHSPAMWEKLLLEIARKEEDIPSIKKLSFMFLELRFNEEFYDIYKSAFTAGDWEFATEELIKHYQKDDKFHDSVAMVLASENEFNRLMLYIKKHSTPERIERYYNFLAVPFPEETLSLFKKEIDVFVSNNTGRTAYEYIVKLLGKMLEIKGGEAVVFSMIKQYKAGYKNRRAMLETLDRFCKNNHID
ncbi:MAG: hypothetical protein LBV68_01850 [Spirochaetaceae bacterium]|jgi:hypothetical protein|nr:hypothetical protein [Spirochaetaceae bacterium]